MYILYNEERHKCKKLKCYNYSDRKCQNFYKIESLFQYIESLITLTVY